MSSHRARGQNTAYPDSAPAEPPAAIDQGADTKGLLPAVARISRPRPPPRRRATGSAATAGPRTAGPAIVPLPRWCRQPGTTPPDSAPAEPPAAIDQGADTKGLLPAVARISRPRPPPRRRATGLAATAGPFVKRAADPPAPSTSALNSLRRILDPPRFAEPTVNQNTGNRRRRSWAG